MSPNSWLALILGVFFGGFFGWLLERWFFRRRRTECEEQSVRVEGELRAQDKASGDAQVRVAGLEADIAALKLAAEAPQVPVLGVKTPALTPELPQSDLMTAQPARGLPGAETEARQIEATLPAAQFEMSKMGVELPDLDLPEVDSDALKGKVASGLGAVGVGLAGLVSREQDEAALVSGPIEASEGEAALPEIDFDRLSAAAEVPEAQAVLEAPKVEIALPEAAVETPQAEVDWPALSAEVSRVAVEAPEVSIDAPSIAAELPELTLPAFPLEAEAPDAAFAALRPATELPNIALTAAGIEAALPEVELTAPTAEVDWPAISAEVEGLAVESPIVGSDAPSIGAELPSVAVGLPDEAVEALTPTPSTATADLTRLEGIGPVYAGKLSAAGITTFAALAAADEARLAEIIAAPAWRKVNYGEWIEQARLAAAGDEAGLTALQARLFSRSADNLTLVSGMGDKAAQALGAAGITSFAALAAASPDRLAEITRAAGVRGGDFNAWISEAGLRAAGKRISKPRQNRAAKMVSCPQDLSRVKGVGAAFETRLYSAGIGTFWALSQAGDEALAQILQVKEFQKVDLAGIKADALRLAEETGTLNRSWDGTPPDDFEPFDGIGEVYEGRLYDAGICTYRALANATVEQLAEICKAPEWRKPDYAGWIAQAKRFSGIAE